MANPRDVQALTFDCYGTLIDWETGLRAYLRQLLDRKGAGGVDFERFCGPRCGTPCPSPHGTPSPATA